jgi:nucleotide-binding universal stress UspA family protein
MKISPTHESHTVRFELGPTEAQIPAAPDPRLSPFVLNKILVPVDFSDCSKKALQYAVPFARIFNAELIVLFVLEPYCPAPEMTTVDWDLLENQMRANSEAQLAKIVEDLPPVPKLRSELRVARPVSEIYKAARELDASVIIISTHGRTGLSHVLTGSTTERIVRHATCPVLIVREREHDFVGAETVPACVA